MRNKLHLVKMDSGGSIALHHLHESNATGLPLIVAHGTVSNAKTVRGLTRYLAKSGFDCWLLEWGGHGQSSPASRRQDFEYPAFHDVPAAIGTVLALSQKQSLFWVSHSGGGHLPLMYLARQPEGQKHVAGLVTMGSQATDAAPDLAQKARASFLWAVTMLLGRTPQAILPVGNEPESTCLLAQWFVWNIQERWLGADGFDYLAALAGLTIPALVIAGGNDEIAPASGCRRFFDALGSSDKTWVLCAGSNGFSKNYSHEELVIGREARAEVFPTVREWLMLRINWALNRD